MLELKKISKTFNPGTVNEKCALHELSLSVPDGDFITIIGANGAGKSTLFGAISGSFLTDSGEILLDGQDVTLLPEYRRSKIIGRLFQDPMRGSAPGMTIEENLALAAGRSGWLGHISRRDRECFRAQLRELNMGLEDRLRQPVGLLSGGQRQALTLLMATIARPKLLLLDEHTAALDPAAAEKILAMTTRIAAEQKLTCLMVTHNMGVVAYMADKVGVMHHGHLVEWGKKTELLKNPQHPYTRELIRAIPTMNGILPQYQETPQMKGWKNKVWYSETHWALMA